MGVAIGLRQLGAIGARFEAAGVAVDAITQTAQLAVQIVIGAMTELAAGFSIAPARFITFTEIDVHTLTVGRKDIEADAPVLRVDVFQS